MVLYGYVFQNYVEEVPDIEVEKIELSSDKTTINKGEIISLNTKVVPEGATDKSITFSSSDSKVLEVSSSGKVTGISSGKATITARANNGVNAKIEITVYSPVTDILLSTDNVRVQKDSSFKINAEVLPDDADNKNIEYKSENELIAKVDNTGNITGISEGNTKIIVSAEDGKISKTIEVVVTRKLQEGEIVFDPKLQVNGNEITGLENKNNTVDSLLSKIQTNYTVEIYNKNGEEISGSNLAGTGSTVKILDNNILIAEYILIMYGDTNGDGKINSIDLLVLQRHILEIEKLENVYVKAGNVRKNGKNPSSVDCLLIQRHILGLQNIEQ